MENDNDYTNDQHPVYDDYSDKLKWHKFLIYFALWAGAVLNVINGVRILTGSAYGNDTDAIYNAFASLQTIDILHGLLMVALGFYQIYVRFQLAGFRSGAPGKLSAMYLITLALNILYLLIVSGVTGIKLGEFMNTNVICAFIESIVFLFINKAYYGKRSHLFVN